MTNEEQRIAIAELCRWKNIVHQWVKETPGPAGTNPITGQSDWLPDYLNDLNAIHEAEKTLDRFHKELYAVHLYCLLTGRAFEKLKAETHGGKDFSLTAWMCACLMEATAAQRAEAFLKTLGKWEGN